MKLQYLMVAAVLLASVVSVSCDSTGGEKPPKYTTRKLPGAPTGEGGGTTPVPPVAEGPKVGEKAPEITGIDTDGVEFKLSDYSGKVVMLDFWGDW